jgi:hypothetical protein
MEKELDSLTTSTGFSAIPGLAFTPQELLRGTDCLAWNTDKGGFEISVAGNTTKANLVRVEDKKEIVLYGGSERVARCNDVRISVVCETILMISAMRSSFLTPNTVLISM